MKTQQLIRTQRIPAGMDEVWAFFSSPANLAYLTPSGMDFWMLSPDGDSSSAAPVPPAAAPHFDPAMYEGQLIDYTIRPLLGIRLYWMTEITHIQDKIYFVDEQRVGPYKIWHHEHHFRVIPGGVEMVDKVHYALHWWAGPALPLVRRKLDAIFNYRTKMVTEKWGPLR